MGGGYARQQTQVYLNLRWFISVAQNPGYSLGSLLQNSNTVLCSISLYQARRWGSSNTDPQSTAWAAQDAAETILRICLQDCKEPGDRFVLTSDLRLLKSSSDCSQTSLVF